MEPASHDRVGTGSALILVGLQNDFQPGGALAVPGSEQLLRPINLCLAAFAARSLPIYLLRDWHPPDHSSFLDFGGPWPRHCVAGSQGAGFPPGLNLTGSERLLSQGCARERDAYSAFQDTSLADELRQSGTRRLFFAGLPTEYCVQFSVLDGLRLGFETYPLTDAITALEIQAGDARAAVEFMLRTGARALRLDTLEAVLDDDRRD